MRRSLVQLAIVSAVAICGSLTAIHGQQPRAASRAPATPTVTVALTVAGQPYQFSGPGRCTYAPAASIFQTAAEMWSAQHAADDRSLALSVWKPKDGSTEMATLSLARGDASHEVSTVRGGGPTSASGVVTFRRSGAGGRFTLNLKTKTGETITGTIDCAAFAQHAAEGG